MWLDLSKDLSMISAIFREYRLVGVLGSHARIVTCSHTMCLRLGMLNWIPGRNMFKPSLCCFRVDLFQMPACHCAVAKAFYGVSIRVWGLEV